MQVSRLFGFAAVLPSGVCAGTMDSRKGNAIVTPAPRRNVRRDRCFFVMNIVSTLHPSYLVRVRALWFFHPHLKGVALHDGHNQRGESIVVARGLSRDGP